MADSLRLLSHVTEAFVDRAPIDWAAVGARVRASQDRCLFENLHLLDALRNTTRLTRPGISNRPFLSLAVRIVVVVAAAQTTCSLVVMGLALASGETMGHRTSQIVLALAFGSASLLLGTASSRDPRSLFLLATFATAASAFARSAVTGLPDTWFRQVDIVLRGVFLEALTIGCLWQFALDFPRVRRFTAFDTFARGVTPVAWLTGTALFGINLTAAYYPVDEGPLLYALRDQANRFFWLFYALALASSVGAILVRSRGAPMSERRKVARFALSIAVGTAPFLVSGFLWAVLPKASNATIFPEHMWIDHLIVAALAATPVLCTVAVMLDRPLEIEIALRRTWRHALARGSVTLIAAAPVVVLLLTVYSLGPVSTLEMSSGGLAWLLLGGIASGWLWAARPRLDVLLHRRGIGGVGDDQEQLARSLERVRLSRGGREIGAVLGRELRSGIGAATVRVLTPEREVAFTDAVHGVARLRSDAILVAMLQENLEPLDLTPNGPILGLLPPRDREWLTANDIALAGALKRRDGAIAALVMCGPKRTGLPFDRRDRWLVQTLSTAAAAAWEAEAAVEKPADVSRPHSPPTANLGEAAIECPRCGAIVASCPLPCGCGADAILASLPHQLGDTFSVNRRIGGGGMGIVYLARDLRLDREVALKTLPEVGADAIARLREEARAMAALNHESLATIYGVEVWRHTPVLVVEYFPEGTLARRIDRGPCSPAMTIELGLRLARALTYMHAQGRLHRDLTPSNIAFTAAGTAKLLDFGLATLMGADSGSSWQAKTGGHRARVTGTFGYLPPEAFDGTPPRPAFDLWGLSVVMLEMVAGRRLFRTGHRGGILHPPTPPDLSEACAAIRPAAPGLSALLEHALAQRPDRRFRTGLELQEALESLASRTERSRGHRLER